MLSLIERIEVLENDLKADPPRISVHNDLPFAILQYGPEQEWEMRRQLRLLATRLQKAGRTVVTISLADLLWESIERSEGLEAVVALEKEWGFEAAQEQVMHYLSDPDWAPLQGLLTERMQGLDPARHVVFLTRAAAMAPHLYFMSKLLEEMKGRTQVTTILLYPGTLEGTTGLRFMNMTTRDAPLGNYRVKIYG